MSTNDQKIVLLLDVTAGMPLEAAKPAVTAFLNLFQLGDQFAILTYVGGVTPVYPPDGLATIDDRSVLDAASAALEALQKPCDMASALIAGTALLKDAAAPRAMVLLSATQYTGTDPLSVLQPDLPVYTVGVGDQGQLDTLRRIASRTGGQFASTEDVAGLMEVLINLIEKLRIARILNLGQRALSNQQQLVVTARFADGTAAGTFLAYWGDPAIVYSAGGAGDPTDAAARTLAVTLLDPNSHPWAGGPAYVGTGFVVFSVPQPLAGSWTMTSVYSGKGTCNLTAVVYGSI
jgi:hypothetical protein